MKIHQFWWDSIKFGEHWWIFMKIVVFCYFSWHLLPTLQKACIFYRFWSPPGEQKVRFSLIFMEIHQFWWNSIKMDENLCFSWKWVEFHENDGFASLPAPGLQKHYELQWLWRKVSCYFLTFPRSVNNIFSLPLLFLIYILFSRRLAGSPAGWLGSMA